MENNLILNKQEFIQNIVQEDDTYALFEIDNRIYALNAKRVLEIMKITEFDYSNQMPSCFLGLIQYEKKPIGIVDLREVFKMQRKRYDINAKVIIYDCSETKIGFICDKVINVKKLEKNNISSMPYQQEKMYKGIYFKNNESIYILNGKNILNYIENNISKYQYKESPKEYLPDDEESIEILKDRKNIIKKLEIDSQNKIQLNNIGITFSINETKYYINMASVKEFFKVNNSKFIKIPNVPEFIFGLINIKGEYISVLDLRRFYSNVYTKIKEKSTIIILNSDEFKIGILADEVLETLNIDNELIIQNKTQKQEEDTITEFVNDNEIYQAIDIDKLLHNKKLAIC